MAKKKKDFLQFLITQKDKAKKHTKQFIERNKQDVSLYEGKHIVTAQTIVDAGGDIVSASNAQSENRYKKPSKMIFTNTESAKSTIFDRLPDLVFKNRNEDSDIKRQLVEGVYEYLKDKLDLMTFANDSLHWFVLSGFNIGFVDYMVKSYEAQQFDESGEPVMDEFGEPMTYEKFEYDDPIVYTGDPSKNYYSEASKYSIDMSKVPFNIREEMINVDLIKDIYGETCEPDAVESTADDGTKTKDANLARTWFLTGNIPSKYKQYVENWDVEAEYYIVFTKKKILLQKRRKRRQCKLIRWYAQPSEFFGFGFGKIGESFQENKELRREQISRNADYHAFAKLGLKNDGDEKVNPELYKDPRANLVIPYTSQMPEFITPPDIGNSVITDLEKTESDAQAAFGLLDISTGAQDSSTVDTATGQTIFAEAAARKMKSGKRAIMLYYRAIVIELFKQCQENWTDPKPITLTDDDGITEEVMVTKEDLADIDFDKDLDIDAESVSVNKDVIREQMIALYDKVKDDPLVDRKKVFTDMLRKGFGITNPDRYIKEASNVEPGTPLMNPETGEQFTVGEAGEVVSQQAQDEMAQPSGEQVAQSQGAVLNQR
ncbi:MAG: hypothetical protein K0U38_01475 [Epsilonproteobacteria bacterium]|nr:hypothetical protein [Campylobacterota bacterium]